MSLKIIPVKKQQARSVLWWVIRSSTKLCARKVKSYEVCLPAFDLCRSNFIWMSLLKRHRIFIDNLCDASLQGDRGSFGESIRKRNVFSEPLTIAFSTAILQNVDYSTVHIALLTNLLVRLSCFRYRL